jgi:hypothetical protein
MVVRIARINLLDSLSKPLVVYSCSIVSGSYIFGPSGVMLPRISSSLPKGLGVIDEVDEFGTFTLDENQKLGVLPPVIQSDMRMMDDLQGSEDQINVAFK